MVEEKISKKEVLRAIDNVTEWYFKELEEAQKTTNEVKCRDCQAAIVGLERLKKELGMAKMISFNRRDT